jgi:UDP-glucose:(heptosyl)LPS alpha-1,3-glucosyltransferase
MPSWIKLPYYDFQVCRRRDEEALYFSNDRLSCLDIHRAGGGTHKTFLKTKGFTLNPLHPVYLWLERRTLRNARHIIAISEMVKNDIIRDYGIEADKITVVYNGIHTNQVTDEEMAEKKSRILREFGVEEGKAILLFVGSGFERKGGEEFLQILSRLKTPFHAFMVGKEKRPGKYGKLAEKLDIAEYVTLTGPRKDVEDFYCASDIFLFPTRYEPFGSVILEAMNFGNAVFTTRQCGGGEILKEEPLMENSRDFGIATHIDRLLANPEALQRIKASNMRLAQDFTIEKNVDKTIEVIERLDR